MIFRIPAHPSGLALADDVEARATRVIEMQVFQSYSIEQIVDGCRGVLYTLLPGDSRTLHALAHSWKSVS
jgi:hypothetical protein